MNVLDRVISAVAPVWGVQRAAARSALRAYDAAKSNRKNGGWITGGGSANAEIGPAANVIRNRSRDLVRNNPHAAQAVRKLTTKIVGTGIVPRLNSGDKAERTRFKNDWAAFSAEADPEGLSDFYGIQALAVRTAIESGEALLRYIPRSSRFGSAIPLQVQVLEPDYIDFGKNEIGNDGRRIIQGVEYDRDGRRVAYWLYDEHPGEAYPVPTRLQSQRVDAAFIQPMFDRLRPQQIHGVSWFFPVVSRFRGYDDYWEAEHMRKLVEACFAVFVTRTSGSSSPLTGKASADAKGRPLTQLAPGMITELSPGDDVKFASPAAIAGTVETMVHMLQEISTGIGIPYESMTGDLTRLNYSSIRAGTLDFWDLLDSWQWLMVIPQACGPTWRRVEQVMAAMGKRPAAGTDLLWTPPVRRSSDPVKDMQALLLELRGGTKTLPDAIVERTGHDPEDHLEQIAETNALLDALGVILDSDGRRSRNGPAPTSKEKPDNGDETAED